MRLKRKDYLYLNETEYRLVVDSLTQTKERLIQQGRVSDYWDNLILKVVVTPVNEVNVLTKEL